MKKIISLFVILLLNSFSTFAQKKDSTDVDIDVDMYVGIGGQIQNNLNINQKLRLSNLPEIPTAMPEFIFGFNVFGEKYSGNLEFSGLYADRSNGANRTRLLTSNFRGNFSYNLKVKPKYAFTAGLNLAFATNQFDIYNENATIDLNNLNPLANGGQISLKNNMFYVGPSAAVYLFRDSKWKVRVNVAYELALSRGQWHSDFLNVTNSVNESGKNRFVFSIVLL
jgi:hypothetical protein